MTRLYSSLSIAAALLLGCASHAGVNPRTDRWSEQQANAWYVAQPWLLGSNYVPRSAINQLEMWQAETFDSVQIDQELAWAEALGMNTMRVFLHDLLWQQDSAGFRKRIDSFLGIAARHHIRPMFVFFDSVWDPLPHLGRQHPPIPGVHNSGWVQSPGARTLADTSQYSRLEAYIQGVLRRFGNDRRILAWDLWNEPGSENSDTYGKEEIPDKVARVTALLPRVFQWARAVHPTQPLTSGVCCVESNPGNLSELQHIQLRESDIITFHNYGGPESFRRQVRWLERYGRPIICTEYMARSVGSTFEAVLPIGKEERVGMINWGFVAGKTQTYLPWDSWQHPYVNRQPAVWHHEVLRPDGRPYRQAEVDLIRRLTGIMQEASVTVAPFGRMPDGRPVEMYTLTNSRRMQVRAISYGGIIQAIRVPDRAGRLGDITLGYDSLQGYLTSSPYFGAIVGRYANRIARGRFILDGQTYQLATNNGPNHLHGGRKGFDKVMWSAESFRRRDTVGVTLRHTSPAGDEGYPGTLRAVVTYSLTPANELIVDYDASTDQATPVNLSQHTYFNLAGEGSGDILGQVLTIEADRYTPVDTTLIPTGVLANVANTPFDFRTATPIGARIEQRDPQLENGRGYDHNFVLNRSGPGLVHAAHVLEPTTGRTLDIFTTEPGLQFYSGNFLDGTIRGKSGHVYQHRSGFCLETQHLPDSPNHPTFQSTILRPGQKYQSRTVFRFGLMDVK